MTDLQLLELRASEIRVRLAELGQLSGVDTETREEIETLGREYADLELKQRAQKLAADVPIITKSDAEGHEYREMMGRANLGNIFDDLLAHRNPTGAEGELQAHLGLTGQQIPLDMIRGVALEQRAVTSAPGQVAQNQHEIIPYIFPQSAAAFLGVSMPTVPVGEAVFPVLTGTLDVHTPAENAAAAETTGAFSAAVLTPKRLQASFFFSVEDRARFAGMSEALRQNLHDGLADGLDKQILAGTDGLFTGTNLPNNAQTTNDDFASYVNHLVWDQIDGRHAATTSDLMMVMGAATFKDMGGTYRNTSVDRSALDRVQELVSGVRVSAHVPAPATNRQDVCIRRGMSESVVAPVWEGVQLIDDQITLAANGQVKITAVMLHAVKVLRTGAGLVKQGTDHS